MTGWTAERGSRLASLRMQVHHFLDARWKYGSEGRSASYRWLAQKMGLRLKDCHVKMFDESTCEKALGILKAGGDYNALAAQSEVVKNWCSSASGV
jgi:hypothetical protein